MVNPMQIYAMRLAEEARKKVEENNIIDKEKLILELKDVRNILSFYKGDLKEDKTNGYSISKIYSEMYDFIIYYTLDKFSSASDKINKLKILTGLGEMFLAEEQLNNKIKKINNFNLGISILHSETFARAFLMPEKLFVKEIIKNSYKGKINITYVANSFELPDIQVLARGNELQLFK